MKYHEVESGDVGGGLYSLLDTIRLVMYQRSGHMASKPDYNVKQASESSFMPISLYL